MKLSRILASLVVLTASVGFGATAHAAYPPGAPGTLQYSRLECNEVKVSDTSERLESWSGRIDYVVTAESTTLRVGLPGGRYLLEKPIPIGPGSLTIGSDVAGFENLGYSLFLIELDDGTANVGVYAKFCEAEPDGVAEPEIPGAATPAAGASTATKPVTGGNTNVLAGFAAALAVGGLAMVVAARRRPAAG